MQIGIELSEGSSGGFASILIHVGPLVYETCTVCASVSVVVRQQMIIITVLQQNLLHFQKFAV